MKKISLTLFVILLFLCATVYSQQQRSIGLDKSSPTSNRRLALVIGNGTYAASPLKNPPNDATDMASALSKLGFSVKHGVNLTQRQMKAMIRDFGQELKGGGQGLFYFAGHGVQLRGRNYLIPVDADITSESDVEDQGVDANLVLGLMDEAGNGLNVIILDACRNNPFARSFRSAGAGLAQVDAPTGTLVAYATAPGKVARDGTGRNGAYTAQLLRQMAVPGLTVEELLKRVRASLKQLTNGEQVPWESSSLVGDFYLNVASVNSTGTSGVGGSVNRSQIDEVEVEREYWETIRGSNDTQDYKDYLQAYPNGAYTVIARAKVRRLGFAKATSLGKKATNTGGNKTSGTAGAANTGMARPNVKNQQGVEMVYIPPGSFMMGSTNGLSDEKPKHRITISQGFYMGKFEVTQRQWEVVMGDKRSHFTDCGTNCPVELVSWNDAQEFINKLNEANDGYKYRLPSEAEWEYACRAGTSGEYAGDLDSIAWYGNNSGNNQIDADSIWNNDLDNYNPRLQKNGGRTHPVGTKQANSFGLYDMHGNVSEWCEDWYHPSYEDGPNDGSAWLSGGEQKDRVVRGGSWYLSATFTRSAYRHRDSPDNRWHFDAGFRLVANVQTQ